MAGHAIDHVTAVSADPDASADRLLGALAAIADAREDIDRAEVDLLDRARRAGLTWREIAGALDLHSPQAAAQRAERHTRRAHGFRSTSRCGR